MKNIIFSEFIEVKLHSPEDFLIIKESLTRIGFSSKKDNSLYQSCHILHSKGRYFIVHFKELFKLDGKPTNITKNDIARRNKIALLLHDWELLDVLDIDSIEDNQASMRQIKIVPFSEKEEWNLVPKYTIGVSK